MQQNILSAAINNIIFEDALISFPFRFSQNLYICYNKVNLILKGSLQASKTLSHFGGF